MNRSDTLPWIPIGHVESEFDEMADVDTLRARPARLVLDPALTDGLLGLQPGDWLVVLFYCHQVRDYRLQRHPRDDESKPLRGVFALRTPYRPNPIGLTVVKLVAIEGNVLTVEGLDALNGSPLVDIKPYAPVFDAPSQPPEVN